MSINGQQPINIGLPNESIGSDDLYTAFTKTQVNFSTLFTCASPYTNFVGLTGIGVTSNATTGTVSITNTGVTNIIAGTNITINRANGNVTISSTGGGGGGGGTVTSVGLEPVSTSRIVVTNSPIVSSGNIGIDLATTGVVAGTYTAPTVTLDAYGRVTAAANTTSSGTVTSVGIIPGSGIAVASSPVTTVGNITVTNTGVVRLTAGLGITLSAPNGIVQISSVYTGSVTSVGINSDTLNVSGSPVTSSGNITVELPSAITLSGNITAANANLGNLVTANFFSGDGGLLSNLQAPTLSNISNGSSNVRIFTNGNVTTSVAGNANILVVTGTGANITGTANVSGNANVGNIGAYAGVFTANITTTGNIYANLGIIGATSLVGTLTTATQTNITSVGTLGALTVTGKVTAGQLQGDGGNISNIQGANISGAVSFATTANSVAGANVSGAVTTAANVTATSLPDATDTYRLTYVAGSSSSTGLNVDGALTYVPSSNTLTAGNIVASTSLQTANITTGASGTAGTITGNWTLTSGSRMQATYADLAEYYQADATYEPGTVLMFGGDNEVTLAAEATSRVAGVVSTNPAYAMNSSCPDIAVAVALQGRVPCKVQGTVRKGDMMISAGSGYAVACSEPRLGQIIGKALENFDLSDGVIEIVVGRL